MAVATVSKLSDLSGFSGVDRVAGLAPSSWKEAVAGYVSDRKATLKADWAFLPSFDAEKRRHEIAAVTLIGERLAKGVEKKPTLKVKGDDREIRQYKIDLARILTPPDWRKLYMPVLDQLASEVEESWLKGVNIAESQAVTREIEELRRFLQRTEAEGKKCQVDVARAPRAVQARDPRTMGIPRPIMK